MLDGQEEHTSDVPSQVRQLESQEMQVEEEE